MILIFLKYSFITHFVVSFYHLISPFSIPASSEAGAGPVFALIYCSGGKEGLTADRGRN